MATTTDLAPMLSAAGTAGAWLAQVANRTGSKRTPDEYLRYLNHFLAIIGGDPAQPQRPVYTPLPTGWDPAGGNLPRPP